MPSLDSQLFWSRLLGLSDSIFKRKTLPFENLFGNVNQEKVMGPPMDLWVGHGHFIFYNEVKADFLQFCTGFLTPLTKVYSLNDIRTYVSPSITPTDNINHYINSFFMIGLTVGQK